MIRAVLCFLIAIALCHTAFAQQSNSQLWVDYIVDHPFANKYLLEAELSYQTLLSGKKNWTSYNFTPDFEINIHPRIDLIFPVPLSWTIQTDTLNTFEARPTIGARFHFTPGKRVETRATVRFEHRFFNEIDGDEDVQVSNRIRVRGELVAPINKPSYYHDKMWYAILDGELFFVLDENVDERYANRYRLRMGLGYRLSYSSRFEFIYTRQSSRDEVETGFISHDNIFRFRFKHYLHKSHPQKLESSSGS